MGAKIHFERAASGELLPVAFEGTPDEVRFAVEWYRAFLTQKIRALKKIMGWWTVGRAKPTEEEISERIRKHGGVPAVLLMAARMLDETALPEQREACAAWLDYVAPHWRTVKSLRGYVVDRGSPDVLAWRRAVLRRDGHRCQAIGCGATEQLVAHHLVHWANVPSLRIELDNGITLCRACHIKHHSTGKILWGLGAEAA